MKNNVLRNKNFENSPVAKQVYATVMYVSCLANDQEVYNKSKQQFERTKYLELANRNYFESIYANALAECGETDKAWEINKNISGKAFSPITDWTLALDPLYQHYFSEIPEYKAMVKRLEQEKLKKKTQ